MTGRTHDLAAFTSLVIIISFISVPKMSLATFVVAIGTNMIGGLLPDIDDETSDIWDKIRGGSIISRLIHPLLGHHRMISHSLFGMALIGLFLHYLLNTINQIFLIDMNIIWWSIMIGFLSHLVMDSLTIEGVPWFFPIPIRFGFPPIKQLRIKTGAMGEKIFIFPGLLVANVYLLYRYYPKILFILKTLIK
jgi:inner membrane protein